MLFRVLVLIWFLPTLVARAADIVDATGRTVRVPDAIQHVLPAGPPAATLLLSLAPDLMLGLPTPLSEQARALLPPSAAKLPAVPRLTGREDVTDKVQALKPDLIIDYGSVSQRYSQLARTTQDRTGIPTILLDGAIQQIPTTVRLLGDILHRQERAKALADLAEALLALPDRHPRSPRVLYARGADGLTVVVPDSDLTGVFRHIGWQPVAPPGDSDNPGPFRRSTIDAIRTLDPDIVIFSDPAMRQALADNTAWQTVRAVRQGQAYIAPALPFGWIEEPPSINRLLGVGWLRGYDATLLAMTFNAVMYGQTLTQDQLGLLLTGVRPPIP